MHRILQLSAGARTALIAFLANFLILSGSTAGLEAQVRATYSQGAAGILRQLGRLQTTASVLLVGAHPDDEDSAFMARSGWGDHARVAYLSLNRGEGGQDAIGPELFEALGIIRTEELLQARTLDGGQQFFTRAFDFGFSKTLQETARMWDERAVLGDVVRVIRTFRPLVIYSIFSGTPADGHGHHQFAGRITPEAFQAAADPAVFPDQIAEGLRPWQALKLYRSAGFGPMGPEDSGGATTRVDTGVLDPVLGRTYAQIAAEGRDQHRSQKMGGPEPNGPRESGLVLVESRVPTPAAESSVFAGIDVSLPGLAALAGLPDGSLRDELASISQSVQSAINNYNALQPQQAVPALADALRAIRAARAALTRVRGSTPGVAAEADFLLEAKERDAMRALQLASGTVVEAVSGEETVNPGQTFQASVRVFVSQPGLVKISGTALGAPKGWGVQRAKSSDRDDTYSISVPADAPATQPYWLNQPRTGWMYDWPPGAPRGKPFDPPLLTASVQAQIGGVPVILVQPMEFRLIDAVRGELHRAVGVVPAITVGVEPELSIIPVRKLGQPITVSVRIQNNSQGASNGTVKLQAPPGWSVTPAERTVTLTARGEQAAAVFTVTPGRTTRAGQYSLKASVTSAGRTFDLSMQTISYPHIQTHRLFTPAAAVVRVLDLAVLPVNVGYIMGSGDLVPEALQRMGLRVTLLSDDDLASGDLSRFSTIVVGIRAAEARPAFTAANNRLLDYARAGGTLIVQYQQNGYEKLAPFPAAMASRVTDETADVRILAPAHPACTIPNRISPADFDGWVQERNLYAFTSFDPRYTALLESHDPGEQPQEGGEVFAKLGKGKYVYTAYAWFRQLPAGVPGAYRLFANLVSLGAER